MRHGTSILDMELDPNCYPHPKPGGDKSRLAGRVNIYFLVSWFISDAGQVSARIHGS